MSEISTRSASYASVFREGNIGNVKIKNRIILPALTSNFATTEGEVTDQLIHFLRARAEGGVGLACIEGAFVDWSGKGAPMQLGIYKDELISGFRRLTEEIHQVHVPLMLQLVHSGRQMTSQFSGTQPIGPSAIACPIVKEVPRALTHSEVKEMVESFAQAARRAKDAGIDIVEFHAGHGYLISNFLSPDSNQREDEYGGSVENRFRFLKEIIIRTKEIVGEAYPLVVRLNATDYTENGLTLEQSKQYAQWLEELGLAALSVSISVKESYHRLSATSGVPDAYQTPLAAEFKALVNIPVITAGKILTLEKANQVLEEQRADFVAMGRSLIADPALPQKVLENREEDIIPCISCNACNQRSRRPQIICVTNSNTSREGDMNIVKTEDSKSIVVIGSGLAGLEFARRASQRGHEVHVLEDKQMGGLLAGARTNVSGQEEFAKATTYFERECSKLGVKFQQLDHINETHISSLNPDAVVIATAGAASPRYRAEGDVPLTHEVLYGLEIPTSSEQKTIVVVGGGVLGSETALYLKKKYPEQRVELLETRSSIIYDAHPTVRFFLEERLQEAGINLITGLQNLQYNSQEINFELHGKAQKIQNAWVVAESVFNEDIDQPFYAKWKLVEQTYVLGDAYEASDLAERVWKAGDLARTI